MVEVQNRNEQLVDIASCEIREGGMYSKNCDDKCDAIIDLLVDDINKPLK